MHTFCKVDKHKSNFGDCLLYKKQQDNKKLLALENVLSKDAEFIAESPSYAEVNTNNRFSLWNIPENSPELSETHYKFLLKISVAKFE